MEYPGYNKTIQTFVRDTINQMDLGSDVLIKSLAIAGSVYWTKARPSTLANVIVIMVASGLGLNVEIDLVRKRVSTKPTVEEWKSYMRTEFNL